MRTRQTNVDMGFVPFKNRRKSSILGCISTEDLLDRIDPPLLGNDDSGGPNQGSVGSDETSHLLAGGLPRKDCETRAETGEQLWTIRIYSNHQKFLDELL